MTVDFSTSTLIEDCSACRSELRIGELLATEEGVGYGISRVFGTEMPFKSPSCSLSSMEDSFWTSGGGMTSTCFPASFASGPSDSEEELASFSVYYFTMLLLLTFCCFFFCYNVIFIIQNK